MHKQSNLVVLGGLTFATVVAGAALTSPGARAAQQASAQASVNVAAVCTMTATEDTEHTATLVNGTYSSGSYPNGIGKTTIKTFCSDQNGYAIYAVGFTNNEVGNTVLTDASLGSNYDIVTGTATSGNAQSDVSNWAMKVSAVSGTYAPTIANGFNSFSSVPSDYTKVASFDSVTDSADDTNIGSSIETTYAAYISNGQPVGTYTGQVRYVLVHPSSAAAPVDYFMQDVATWGSSLLPGETIIATDTRDGQEYNVGRLADGNIWLLDNLALDLSTVGTLTPENTNITSNWTAPAEITTWSDSPTDPQINAESKNIEQSYGSGNGKVGVYYNYCAATAGTYCMDSSSGSGNASQDICPKGWRLPTGGSSGEYQALYTAYSSNATNFKNAFRTPLSGTFRNSLASGQGSFGYFWSSTYYNAGAMYRLHVTTTNVNPQDYRIRNYGFSVRCVFDPLAGIHTMQDFGNLSDNDKNGLLNAMDTGTTYELKDSRDGQTYNIAKLADGRVWLLDNLALGATTLTEAISPSNTNIPSGTSFTLPASSSTGFNSYDTAMINTDSANLTFSYGDGEGKAGVYYNYCAATAGTYCYAEGAGIGDEATADICPKGWRLPTSDLFGEYPALYTAYNSNVANFNNALHSPLSGRFRDSSASNQGSGGYFWSSTRFSGDHMFILIVNSSSVGPREGYARRGGLSIRCVLDGTIDYNISYDKNTTDTVTNMPSTQSGGVSNKTPTINLSSNTPSRAGYAFNGWCDTRPTTSNGTDSCSGTAYGSGQAYPLTLPTTTATLYAMWEVLVLPSLAMQNVTASTCTTSPTRVYDTRDRHVYTIQKLADNKCWLLDNLALGATTLTEAISPSNTNIPSGTSFTLPASISTGFGSYTEAQINTDSANFFFSYGDGEGKAGVYYNYCAATAGTYCYDKSAGTGDATADICPKGWRIPTDGPSGEYQALYTAYNSNATNFKNALRTPLSGLFNNGSASDQGYNGYFWPSTHYDAANMYAFRVSTTGVYPQSVNSRVNGFSVRCVLK